MQISRGRHIMTYYSPLRRVILIMKTKGVFHKSLVIFLPGIFYFILLSWMMFQQNKQTIWVKHTQRPLYSVHLWLDPRAFRSCLIRLGIDSTKFWKCSSDFWVILTWKHHIVAHTHPIFVCCTYCKVKTIHNWASSWQQWEGKTYF